MRLIKCAFLLLALPAVSLAGVYKCKSAGGGIVYSARPCRVLHEKQAFKLKSDRLPTASPMTARYYDRSADRRREAKRELKRLQKLKKKRELARLAYQLQLDNIPDDINERLFHLRTTGVLLP